MDLKNFLTIFSSIHNFWSYARAQEKEDYRCEVYGRKINKEEYESYDGLCWECWDNQMTEECEFEEEDII